MKPMIESDVVTSVRDFAPVECAVFPEVMSQLEGRRFSTLISQCGQDWYRDIFDKWVKRHRKCLAYDGAYFEIGNRQVSY